MAAGVEGQISIFDMDTSYADVHHDRNGNTRKPPEWMHYERCENCTRWVIYPTNEQPPCGWGIYGFCNEHKQRVADIGYCQCWEDKRRI